MKAPYPLDYDMLAMRAREDLPDKPVGSDVRQHNQEAVSEKVTGGTPHSPYAIAVLSLAIDKLPSTSVSPASPSNDAIFDKDQSIMLDKTINSNTYEVNPEAGHHTLDILNEGNRPAPDNMSPPIAKARGNDQGPLVETASIECSNEHFSGHKELVPRFPTSQSRPIRQTSNGLVKVLMEKA